jgi:hypothetical protein
MRARIGTKSSVPAAVRRGLEPFRASAAPPELGRDHPFSRLAMLAKVAAWLAVAGSAAVTAAALGAAERSAWGIPMLCAALVAELVLLMLVALARQLRREQVLRLIASGCARLPVEEIAREAQRLVTPAHRADLAERLERALDDALRWHQLPVATRPPPGITLLCGFAPEVRAITGQLRSGQSALPGVALLELFLVGGYGSVLYAGDQDLLRECLGRIRYLICADTPADGGHRRG